jgi:hypothetical protein
VTDNHEALDTLRDAILAVWEDYGWIQGELGNETEGYCMVGAFRKATGQDKELGLGTQTVPFWLAHALQEAGKRLFGLEEAVSPIGLNDRHATSAEDMRLLVKHAFHDLHDMLDQAAEPEPPVSS